VSREEAANRYHQILAEGALIRDELIATGEGRSTFAPGGYSQWGNLYSITYARKFSAPFSAPQQDESEEQFLERSKQGRAIDQYYQPVFEEHRRDMEREAVEEERLLAGAQV
jgi:hypothetical protein